MSEALWGAAGSVDTRLTNPTRRLRLISGAFLFPTFQIELPLVYLDPFIRVPRRRDRTVSSLLRWRPGTRAQSVARIIAAVMRLTRGSAPPAVVTDQAQALDTPDALHAGQESYVNLQEGPLPFSLHDAPSPSFDLCHVADVHDDRSGTRGRLAIYEMSRFPLMLPHSCKCFVD